MLSDSSRLDSELCLKKTAISNRFVNSSPVCWPRGNVLGSMSNVHRSEFLVRIKEREEKLGSNGGLVATLYFRNGAGQGGKAAGREAAGLHGCKAVE